VLMIAAGLSITAAVLYVVTCIMASRRRKTM
jgi:hypothetical protein